MRHFKMRPFKHPFSMGLAPPCSPPPPHTHTPCLKKPGNQVASVKSQNTYAAKSLTWMVGSTFMPLPKHCRASSSPCHAVCEDKRVSSVTDHK